MMGIRTGSKALPVYVLGLILGAAVLVGCGQATTTAGDERPVELIPEEADVLMHANVGAVLADEDVQALDLPKGEGRHEEARTVGDLLEALQGETGIDLRQFPEVIAFGKAGDDDFAGLVGQGDFEAEAIMEAFEAEVDAPVTRSDYKGHELVMVEDEKQATVAVLNGRTVAAGSRTAVEGVIDVLEGDRAPVSGEVMALYEELGDPWVKLAMAAPPQELLEGRQEGMGTQGGQEGMGMQGMGFDPGILMNLSQIGATLDKQDDLFEGRLLLSYEDEAQAAAAAESIEAMLTLMTTFMPEKESGGLFNSVQVTTAGADVELTSSATLEELRKLGVGHPEMALEMMR